MTIDVAENSSPLVKLRLRVTDEEGHKQARKLVGANPIELFIKTSPDAADGTPAYSYPGAGIAVVDVVDGRVAIQFSSTDTQLPSSPASSIGWT